MLANRQVLLKNGICYPEPEASHPGNGLKVTALDAVSLQKAFGDADTMVFSHENLFSMAANFSALGTLCQSQGVRLSVLVFLRPFSEFIYGDYSQFLKQNIDSYIREGQAYGGQSFEEFAVSRRSQISAIGWLKAWQRVSPSPILIEHHRKIRAVCENLLGPLPLKWEIDRDSSNPSLRVLDCEDISTAISGGVPKGKVNDMYKLAFSKVGLEDRGKTPERTRWLEALFKGQNDKIQEIFNFDNRLVR